MKAIIETGGKQYYVSEGSVIYVEKLDVAWNPFVDCVSVEGVVLKQGKNKKITIFKYKPKKKSTRVKKGHRQPYTKVEIKKIVK